MLGFGLLVVMNVMNVYYKILCEHIFFFFSFSCPLLRPCEHIFNLFGYVPGYGITELHENPMFNFVFSAGD